MLQYQNSVHRKEWWSNGYCTASNVLKRVSAGERSLLFDIRPYISDTLFFAPATEIVNETTNSSVFRIASFLFEGEKIVPVFTEAVFLANGPKGTTRVFQFLLSIWL